jgi:hypothetical protein
LALTRERGDRHWERQMLGQLVAPLAILGRWDEAATVCGELIAGEFGIDAMTGAAFLITIAAARGEESTVERCRVLVSPHGDSSYVDLRMCAEVALARDAIESGDPQRALDLAKTAALERVTGSEFVSEAYGVAVEAAMEINDDGAMAELIGFVAELPPGRSSPLLRAGAERLSAQRDHSRGDDDAAWAHEAKAVELLRAAHARPLLAGALLESARRRDDPEALAEARAIYRELGATRWLERVDERWGATA